MKKYTFLKGYLLQLEGIFKYLRLLCIYIFLSGMTIYDASDYGSSILICSDNKGAETTVRYWSLVKKYPKKTEKSNLPEDMVFDQSTRKSFPISACRRYICSPEPWRMEGCVIK